MTAKQLAKYIEDPKQLNKNTVEQFNALIKQYPYFQVAFILLLKNLQLVNQKKFKEFLPYVSTFISDRKALYFYLNDYKKEHIISSGETKKIEQNLVTKNTNSDNNRIVDKEKLHEQRKKHHESLVNDFFKETVENIKAEENENGKKSKEQENKSIKKADKISDKKESTKNISKTDEKKKDVSTNTNTIKKRVFKPEDTYKKRTEGNVVDNQKKTEERKKEIIKSDEKKDDSKKEEKSKSSGDIFKKIAQLKEEKKKAAAALREEEIKRQKELEEYRAKRLAKSRNTNKKEEKDSEKNLEDNQNKEAISDKQIIENKKQEVKEEKQTKEEVKKETNSIDNKIDKKKIVEKNTDKKPEPKQKEEIDKSDEKTETKSEKKESIEVKKDASKKENEAIEEKKLTAADLVLQRIKERRKGKDGTDEDDAELKKPEKKEEESLSKQDNLIEDFLEKQPRIDRNKKLETEGEDIGKRSIAENEGYMTEKLATIFVKQKQFEKAIEVYEKLILKFPEKNSYFAARIEEVKKIIESK